MTDVCLSLQAIDPTYLTTIVISYSIFFYIYIHIFFYVFIYISIAPTMNLIKLYTFSKGSEFVKTSVCMWFPFAVFVFSQHPSCLDQTI